MFPTTPFYRRHIECQFHHLKSSFKRSITRKENQDNRINVCYSICVNCEVRCSSIGCSPSDILLTESQNSLNKLEVIVIPHNQIKEDLTNKRIRREKSSQQNVFPSQLFD
ncbi:CLUMA_CG019211, isoform A [Clunio marinus]|uniref:CLUMA_CG019211, isoform A n=1 Tax=Clunio marinus TaxID=568069 RepID=A0A1J1J0N8_9DIPT|nr:CLUMA_CG019211, isoform A [Clunio marinus]